jgi:hypothetical protein
MPKSCHLRTTVAQNLPHSAMLGQFLLGEQTLNKANSLTYQPKTQRPTVEVAVVVKIKVKVSVCIIDYILPLS